MEEKKRKTWDALNPQPWLPLLQPRSEARQRQSHQPPPAGVSGPRCGRADAAAPTNKKPSVYLNRAATPPRCREAPDRRPLTSTDDSSLLDINLLTHTLSSCTGINPRLKIVPNKSAGYRARRHCNENAERQASISPAAPPDRWEECDRTEQDSFTCTLPLPSSEENLFQSPCSDARREMAWSLCVCVWSVRISGLTGREYPPRPPSWLYRASTELFHVFRPPPKASADTPTWVLCNHQTSGPVKAAAAAAAALRLAGVEIRVCGRQTRSPRLKRPRLRPEPAERAHSQPADLSTGCIMLL
ncbi:hypothetical protein FQA47_016104 [Oryzias melastigma]|uniref:Uncharacterized protein n=1 Tax=Oryzias melastigma TaxID=30732 RepID=A0A834FNF9_ORYME|nr:hypothetical protein FQA47_016104 [Oryzias melastigma]